jgi:rsbT co-antagonist protein RsbR
LLVPTAEELLLKTTYTDRFGFTEPVLRERLRYFDIRDADLALLAEHSERAEQLRPAIVEAFYAHLLSSPETAEYLSVPGLVDRLKHTQASYFQSLFHGRIDLAYVEERLRVGAVHERIGVPPRWYIGAYSRYLVLAHAAFHEQLEQGVAVKLTAALEKVLHFDAALAMDAYIAAHTETTTRQRAAIRELSTPVIRVHDRVLLLPLIGTVDSHRAQEVMQSTLVRISEEQARVLLMDIAGVAVVDTLVADHLLKMTAAVRLLGAQTVLTGISPSVARTMVELGVDVGTMHTRNTLADGLALALDLIGFEIRPVS